MQPDGEVDPDTVGRAFAGVEMRIDDTGEVLVRSGGGVPGLLQAARGDRARRSTEDGWLRTGDAGFIDRRGHLVIVDRAHDVGKLADGTALAPQFLENKLKFSPYIGEAVVLAATPGRLSPRSSRSTRRPSAIGRSGTTSPTPRSRI